MNTIGTEKSSGLEFRKKIEEELDRRESDTVLYWKGELEKILAKRISSLAGIQSEVQNLVQRMQNRLKILQGSSRK